MRDEICRKFCHYFKPSKEEDLACLGFVVAERLIERGMKYSSGLPVRRPDEKTEEILVRNFCVKCPFYGEDCDYVLDCRRGKSDAAGIHSDKEDPPPCGGFIFLGLLLEGRIVSIDDITNMV
jgi:hypothetical protein